MAGFQERIRVPRLVNYAMIWEEQRISDAVRRRKDFSKVIVPGELGRKFPRRGGANLRLRFWSEKVLIGLYQLPEFACEKRVAPPSLDFVIHHVQRLTRGQSRFVRTFGCQGIENVRNLKYPGREGDLFTLQAVGVA